MSLTLTDVKDAIRESDKDTVREVLDTYGDDVLKAALECGVNVNDIREAYQGEFKDDVDFAQHLADELGAVDKDASWPMNCIDWEYAAKELMYDYSKSNGHYFRNL